LTPPSVKGHEYEIKMQNKRKAYVTYTHDAKWFSLKNYSSIVPIHQHE